MTRIHNWLLQKKSSYCGYLLIWGQRILLLHFKVKQTNFGFGFWMEFPFYSLIVADLKLKTTIFRKIMSSFMIMKFVLRLHIILWHYTLHDFDYGPKQNCDITPANHIPCYLSPLKIHLPYYRGQHGDCVQKS